MSTPSQNLAAEVEQSIAYTRDQRSSAEAMHPAVTSTANYVRSLQGMIGNTHPSVLYAQAVLRPSLALAQGHSLALIQGITTTVYEWNIAPEGADFDADMRGAIKRLKDYCRGLGMVCSVETGEGIHRGKHTVETLRISVRDNMMVHAVILYASKTMLMHRIQDLDDEEGKLSGEIYALFHKFCMDHEPVQKGYINHVVVVDGKITSTRNEIHDNGRIIDACYPFIKGGATALVHSYLRSSSSILNLYGVGGTGKSTLMRKIAALSEDRHTLLVDNPLIYKDSILAGNLMAHVRSLCSDGKKVLLMLEEVDKFIQEKSAENDFLVQLLSISSGVIEHDVKVVLASNLKNIGQVLDVLNRSGRAFGTIEFVEMYVAQAHLVRQEMGLPPRDFGNTTHLTLADAICDEVISIGENKNRLGFTAA